MRKSVLSLFLAVALVSGAATSSFADGGGGGGFWERMSGPGKWAYWFGYFRLCLDKKKGEFCTPTRNRVWLNLGGSYASTGDQAREELRSPDLHQISIDPSVDFRVANVSGCVPLHLGGGVGFHHFWGEEVGFNRVSLEPRVTLLFPNTPVDSTHVGFRYAVKFFLKGFTAEDFGDPTGTFTTNGTDAVHTFLWFISF